MMLTRFLAPLVRCAILFPIRDKDSLFFASDSLVHRNLQERESSQTYDVLHLIRIVFAQSEREPVEFQLFLQLGGR
jgi:hypothetical protein